MLPSAATRTAHLVTALLLVGLVAAAVVDRRLLVARLVRVNDVLARPDAASPALLLAAALHDPDVRVAHKLEVEQYIEATGAPLSPMRAGHRAPTWSPTGT